jgi:hypothetical protein
MVLVRAPVPAPAPVPPRCEQCSLLEDRIKFLEKELEFQVRLNDEINRRFEKFLESLKNNK